MSSLSLFSSLSSFCFSLPRSKVSLLRTSCRPFFFSQHTLFFSRSCLNSQPFYPYHLQQQQQQQQHSCLHPTKFVCGGQRAHTTPHITLYHTDASWKKKMADDRTWTASEIRKQFIDYFKEREHTFVPSSSVVPQNDPTLLFANAGMNQYKSIFLCTVDPNSDFAKLKRAVNSQKCIRAGGKHNDLDDVGKDNYHHTFFEMLGNWSFGDFFKKEAIDWSWNLLVDIYGLDKSRLYATYFEGDEKSGLPPDHETRDLWAQYLPGDRILPGNMKDNFWEMGEIGPCGPCTEIHYDRVGGRDASSLVNQDDPTVLEVWNLVFMQLERRGPTDLIPLPANHVDTGMGLERLASILQGKMSNYDIDLFTTIFSGIEKFVGCGPYTGKFGEDCQHDNAYRVIADHVRMLSMAIADGQKPGPDGRAYVMRRVVRRAVRYGSEILKAKPGLLPSLVPYVVETLGEAFPSLKENSTTIVKTLAYEENLFMRTLKNGTRKFQNIINKMKKLGVTHFAPKEAANLFTTFGFPADLTRIMVEEEGFQYDECTVDELLLLEKKKSEEARKKKKEMEAHVVKMDPNALAYLVDTLNVPPTNDSFKYEQDEITAKVLAIYNSGSFLDHVDTTTGTVGLFLDCTNFYAESGGQEYDTGRIVKSSGGIHIFEVGNVQSFGGLVYHSGVISEGELKIGDEVELSVNMQRRQPLMANHTCTHVLNHALRDQVSDQCEQKGSLVMESRFRFDYNHGSPLTCSEISKIQEHVSKVIDENHEVFIKVVPLEEAKNIFGVRCLFDEQYPNPVRVVSVGASVEQMLRDPDNKEWYRYSVEFCGGTHLSCSSEIANFVIINDEGVGAGVRRITAVTGPEAVHAIEAKEEFEKRVKATENLQKAADFTAALKQLRDNIDSVDMPADARMRFREKLNELGKKVASLNKDKKNEASSAAKVYADDSIKEMRLAPKPFWVGTLEVQGKNVIMTNAIKLIQEEFPDLPVLLLSSDTTHKDSKKHKVTVVSIVPQSKVEAGLKADAWAKSAAVVLGGKGGGRETTAQGSGPKVKEIDQGFEEAVAFARKYL